MYSFACGVGVMCVVWFYMTVSHTRVASFFFMYNSVATVDYDYSKAYGGADTSVVSDAGGTMGENTRDTGSQIAAATAARAALGASFDSGEGGKNPNVKEEVIEISAPAGKLGVVIGMYNV